MSLRISVLLFAFGVAACVDQGQFPSLAKRPIETSQSQPAVSAPPPITISDPATLARVDAALQAARKSVAPFDAALAAARPAVASAAGAAQGSERWIEGQLAASRVEPLLVPAASALADIEEELRRAMINPASADRLAIDTAIAEVGAIVERQQQASRALTERLAD